MNKFTLRTTLVAGILVAAVIAEALPPGSFIRRPVRSTRDLVAHASTDRVVMDRYMRHFRLSRAQVIEYLSGLHMAKLVNGGAYQVYNVHNGEIKARVLQLKKGTLVFADNSGRPILQKVCGNPMVWGVPPVGTTVATTDPAAARDVIGETSPTELMTVVQPDVAPVVELPAPTGPVLPPQVAGSVASRGSLLPLLLVGAGAGALLIRNGDDDDIPPFPEPATMLVIGAGAGWMALRRRKK